MVSWMEALTGCLGLSRVWTEIQLIYVVIQAWHDTFLSGERWFWMSEPRCDVCVCAVWVIVDRANSKSLDSWSYLIFIVIHYYVLTMFTRVRTFRTGDSEPVIKRNRSANETKTKCKNNWQVRSVKGFILRSRSEADDLSCSHHFKAELIRHSQKRSKQNTHSKTDLPPSHSPPFHLINHYHSSVHTHTHSHRLMI